MSGIEGAFKGRLGGFALDATFQVAGTGLTALTGPSGAGKSTLLRCIAGLERLPGGLVVEGEVWQDARTFLAPHKRPVGMVFQDASLFPHLSVKQNLVYGLRRAPTPHAIELDEAVDLLGLAPLLRRTPGKLSGGERQRVAVGRALLSQPRLLLMDEPLSSLDVEAKAEILPYLERLHTALAIPVLYVTHDAGEVRRLADHLLVMQEGRIVRQARQVRTTAEADPLAGLSEQAVRALALSALDAGLKPAPLPGLA